MITPVRTWVEVVGWVGLNYGVEVTPEQAEYVLWNHTGYPSFWAVSLTTRPAILQCVDQLKTYFQYLAEGVDLVPGEGRFVPHPQHRVPREAQGPRIRDTPGL